MIIIINIQEENLQNYFFENEEVVPLELNCLSLRMSYFRVWSRKQNTCIEISVENCVVVNPELSQYWIIDKQNDSPFFVLTPKAWIRPNFWKDYEDGMQYAIELFHENASLLLEESNQNPNEVLKRF